jgi:hypothetical protein
MKHSILILGATALIAAGCSSTYDSGPYLPQKSKTPAYEDTERLILLDPGVQYSVTVATYLQRTLEDGRLEVVVGLRNRENRRLEVQADCVFKDEAGAVTDEAPFQAVILTENATEQVKFVSLNALAKKYTVRVRQAR